MNETSLSAADVAAVTNNNDGMFGGGNGAWWIIILFLFVFCGWGGRGGWGGGSGSGAMDNYVLTSDFSQLSRQMDSGFASQERRTDSIINGICDLGYSQLSLNNQLGMNMMQGFNATQAQLADCCCKTQQNIKDTQYAIATASGDIRGAIKDCCCDTEKQFMQTRFDNAQANCATLQAIDKVGDRIIDYLAADKAQTLRDENQALRLAASQQAQNNYLIQQLRPMPVPAYQSCNPWAASLGFGNNCGCGTWG